jgi:hypothetical protein
MLFSKKYGFSVLFAAIICCSVGVQIFTGCNLGKSLPEEKKIYIEYQIEFSTQQNTVFAKYLYNSPESALINEFKSELEKWLAYNKLSPVSDPSTADFKLTVLSVVASESETNYTVDDAESPYNGQTYSLASCKVSCSANLYQIETGGGVKSLTTIDDSAFKDEKVKNNRTLVDMMVGDNKDNSKYRLKGLSDDVFVSVAGNCGQAMAATITRKLARWYKKGKI